MDVLRIIVRFGRHCHDHILLCHSDRRCDSSVHLRDMLQHLKQSYNIKALIREGLIADVLLFGVKLRKTAVGKLV